MEADEIYNLAVSLYEKEEYDKALPLFLKLADMYKGANDNLLPKNATLFGYIGNIYLVKNEISWH